MQSAVLDADTERAAKLFIHRISRQYDMAGAIVFGSRARHLVAS